MLLLSGNKELLRDATVLFLGGPHGPWVKGEGAPGQVCDEQDDSMAGITWAKGVLKSTVNGWSKSTITIEICPGFTFSFAVSAAADQIHSDAGKTAKL